MSDSLDLRYPSSPENDGDRAEAIFSGAILIYRALPAMHELVDCLREITRQELGLNDPCIAESELESEYYQKPTLSRRRALRIEPRCKRPVRKAA